MQTGDQVRLRNDLSTVWGGSYGKGAEYTIWRRFSTRSGDRLALADVDGRVVFSCIRLDQVEGIE